MSCVREGSVEPPARPPPLDTTRHGEGRTGRFFRGLRRMFKRRGSGGRADASPDPKSSSTSELLDADRVARRSREGAYGSLSVSHDSVFTGERSGDESDDRPSPGHHGTHFVTHNHRAELVAAVRRRGRGDGSDDDEDLGLPRSPPASPPTDKADKRHHTGISHSSCSDLLSVGSSEMDEDSSSGTHHNSHDHSNNSDHSDLYNSSEPPTGVAPLSHSAAKHKMAVRPRRTHGAPRRKKNTQMAATALPITPELNEEMIRSATPDVISRTSEVVTESFSSSSTTTHHAYVKEQHIMNKHLETPSDTKLKSSSLPPGLALSQIMGQTPAKLSIAEANTPRSSIKRSKSSSQGKYLNNEEETSHHASTSESHIYKQEKSSRYRTETKNAEDTYLIEKKPKPDKKHDSEAVKPKKEESFFSRLLLRKSGKKKKDQTDSENDKKNKADKISQQQQYKVVDTERMNQDNIARVKPVPAERSHKTAGQRAFDNQMHKRIDNKGAYVQEGVYKDVYSAAKVSGVEYNITDLKIAEETDRMLNREMKNRFSRRDDFMEKIVEKPKRSSKENIDNTDRDPFNLHGHERSKKPASSAQKAYEPKAFIDNHLNTHHKITPNLMISEEETKKRNLQNDFSFNSGSMPKNIPYFNPNIVISASASPPISSLHASSEHVKHINRSSEQVTEYGRERLMDPGNIPFKLKHVASTEDPYLNSGLRSLGDEFVDSRNSIGKSHSFRYASETTSISSQENQMPSLPAIVGISEPFLESWEVNYRRNLSHEEFRQQEYVKRLSTKKYNIIPTNHEINYDSLPSTDSSYLDSLKTDTQPEEPKLFNSIHITVDSKKRNSDISQIEAKIDDIISSPKPIIASILKSSSLDSVKSSPEKHERRKTISVETPFNSDRSKDYFPYKEKSEYENFVSVTVINREETPVQCIDGKVATITAVDTKLNKSDEKLQKTAGKKPGVPEFLKIQLNKVDTKPVSNVVLTANITPKKTDSPTIEKNQEIDLEIVESKTISETTHKKEAVTVNKKVDSRPQNLPLDSKSPGVNRKTSLPASPIQREYYKNKSISVDAQVTPEKQRTNSLSTEGSTEKMFDNISMDQKSHSSFGSKSSIQSTDSNEPKTPERNEETVIYRKKATTLVKERSGKKNDDEPELMKVFARRSLKLKDSEAETIAQEIAEINKRETESENTNKAKLMKNEFNDSIKSRDSDKENEDNMKADDNKIIDIAARVSQFGVPHYQRSVSVNHVPTNAKRDSAPVSKSEVNKYKKDVSDSTPEKRLRNRTFPDSSNDREDIKSIVKSDAYKADTLKRPWQKKDEEKKVQDNPKVDEAVINKDSNKEKVACESEKEKDDGAADGSPQFKGILQMRAEWERRAKQGMTK